MNTAFFAEQPTPDALAGDPGFAAAASAPVAASSPAHEGWPPTDAIRQSAAAPRGAGTGVRRAVFVDPASRHLLALAQRVSAADVTTLLVGPTGAGKEVMARVLHESSPRRNGPFVAINCAAMPEQLIESQLFGHEKGAFTGAQRTHKGLFEQAEGGTLFLDEIGDMPAHLQTKLLRVLQERQVVRLGGESPVPVNVRLVAATNKDLRQAIATREFREDLYYRIATFRLALLPLAQRPGDILPLALQFVTQHPSPAGEWQFTPQAQQMLLHYAWPGNVRELENVMRRAVVISQDGVIGPGQLMFDDWLDAHESAAWPQTAAPASVGALPSVPAASAITPSSGTSASTEAAPSFGAAAAGGHLPQPVSVSATLPTPAPGAPAAVWSSAAPAVPGPMPASMPASPPVEPTTPVAAIPAPASLPGTSAPAADLQSAVRHNESRIILATIAASASRNEAAARLGISPRTLRYKLAQFRAQGLISESGLAAAGGAA